MLWHKEQAGRQRHLEIHHLWFSPSQGWGLSKYFFPTPLPSPVKYETFSHQNTMDHHLDNIEDVFPQPTQFLRDAAMQPTQSSQQPWGGVSQCFPAGAAQEMSSISTEWPQVLHQPNHRLGTCLALG